MSSHEHIREDLEKRIELAKKIPCPEENPVFRRISRSNKADRNHKLNKHRTKTPENANLYDEDYSQTYDEVIRERRLNETEIACSIKEANGGISYSNELLEQHWKSRQHELSSSSDDVLSESSSSSSMVHSSSKESPLGNNNKLPMLKAKSEENKNVSEEILKQCKVSKNAAIRGLIKNHSISLKDLRLPNGLTVADLDHKGNTNIQNENVPPVDDTDQDKYRNTLVPCPDDPDVYVQPLQAYGTIDESKYKEIDFTVPHIGKKKVVTPRQFFCSQDDSDFVFVKKNSKGKK